MSLEKIPEFKLTQENLGDLPFKIEVLEKNVGYDPRSPHRHNYYEIFFFEEGGGLHMVDFQEMEIKKGDVHIMSPGQIHYMHREPQSAGWVIKFTREFYLSNVNDQETLHRIPFLNNKASEPRVTPDAEEFKDLIGLVDRIREEHERHNMGYRNMIHNYLNLILMKCHRLYNYVSPNSESLETVLCNSFKTVLEEFFLNHHRVGFYCEKLGVSDDKLNQAIKLVNGRTPSGMISNRLLLEAKRCLLHSDWSIKEIAYHLNFQDNAYFNRWFKKHENCSPGTFRSASREKYHT